MHLPTTYVPGEKNSYYEQYLQTVTKLSGFAHSAGDTALQGLCSSSEHLPVMSNQAEPADCAVCI